ncbi:hypothetical protein FA95DRAFT_1503498, partial [Auriscalpium vulgare]
MRVLELRALDTRGARTLNEAVEPRRVEAEGLNVRKDADGASDIATAGGDITLATSVMTSRTAPEEVSQNAELWEQVKLAYVNDTTFGKVVDNVKAYPTFALEDGLLTTDNRAGERVTCIPQGAYGKRSMIEFVIDHGHRVVGHMGPQKTAEYLR